MNDEPGGLELWEVVRTELALDTPWLRVRKDAVRLPNGLVVPDYYYVDGGHFGQVFAVTPDQQVVFVRQYKHPVKSVVLELPAGQLEHEDADPLAGAQRELVEETGYGGGDWLALDPLHVSAGKSNKTCYGFLATGVTRLKEPKPDPTETIHVVLVPLNEVLALLVSGEVKDTNSLAVGLLALRTLHTI